MHGSIQDEFQRLRAKVDDLTGAQKVNEELLQDLCGFRAVLEQEQAESQQLRCDMTACNELSRSLQEEACRLRPNADEVDSLREENEALCNELKNAQAMYVTLIGQKTESDPPDLQIKMVRRLGNESDGSRHEKEEILEDKVQGQWLPSCNTEACPTLVQPVLQTSNQKFEQGEVVERAAISKANFEILCVAVGCRSRGSAAPFLLREAFASGIGDRVSKGPVLG